MSSIEHVNCSKVVFQPGDKVLVRCMRPITKEQRKKIADSIRHWAGVQIDVLVYNACDYDISIENEHGAAQLQRHPSGR